MDQEVEWTRAISALVIGALLGSLAGPAGAVVGAVAGGPTEAIATFGLVAIVGSQIAAIVMLLRILSRSHPIRTIVAIISICCSGASLCAAFVNALITPNRFGSGSIR